MEQVKEHLRLVEERLDKQDLLLAELVTVTTDIKNALIFGQVATKIVRVLGYFATAIVAIWLFGEKVWSKLH